MNEFQFTIQWKNWANKIPSQPFGNKGNSSSHCCFGCSTSHWITGRWIRFHPKTALLFYLFYYFFNLFFLFLLFIVDVCKDSNFCYLCAISLSLSQVSADVRAVHCAHRAEPAVLFQRGAVRLLDSLLSAPQQPIEEVLVDEEAIRSITHGYTCRLHTSTHK